MNIVRTDKFLILGDSISDPNYTFQFWLPTIAKIAGYYSGGGTLGGGAPVYPAAGLRAPVFVNKAVTSQTTVEVLAGLSANLALNPGTYTGLLIMQGINDAAAINASTLAMGPGAGSFINNVAAIITGCTGAGITKILWVGPLSDGELYPTGQNAIDASIDAVDAQLAIQVPTFNTGGVTAEYVPLRGPVYGVREPLLNTAANGYADPHGLANGPLCTPVISPGVIAGLHPNAFGRSFCTVEAWKKITLT